MRKVVVVPYDSRWPEKFEEEAANIREIFGETAIRLDHIGSTSVPGLAAKPIIDLLGQVDDITVVDPFNDLLAVLGYEAMGEYGLPGRRFFRKGGEQRTHHLHIYEKQSPEVRRHLAFRDYLRCHPVKKEAYGALKVKLAEQHSYNIEEYIDGKDPFIKQTEKEALLWAEDE